MSYLPGNTMLRKQKQKNTLLFILIAFAQEANIFLSSLVFIFSGEGTENSKRK